MPGILFFSFASCEPLIHKDGCISGCKLPGEWRLYFGVGCHLWEKHRRNTYCLGGWTKIMDLNSQKKKKKWILNIRCDILLYSKNLFSSFHKLGAGGGGQPNNIFSFKPYFEKKKWLFYLMIFLFPLFIFSWRKHHFFLIKVRLLLL